MSLQPSLLSVPVAGLTPISLAEANALIDRWDHYLGPCKRPFGADCWALEVDGVPVCVAISASTVSEHIRCLDGTVFHRDEIVELARLCRDPQHRWSSRPTLRLWREIAAWPYWAVTTAVAYSQNGRHDGDIYRFDGWTRQTDKAGSSGGGAWTRPRYAADAVHGKKTLWTYTLEEAS